MYGKFLEPVKTAVLDNTFKKCFKLALIYLIYKFIFTNSKNTSNVSIKFHGIIGCWDLASTDLGPSVQGGWR